MSLLTFAGCGNDGDGTDGAVMALLGSEELGDACDLWRRLDYSRSPIAEPEG